MKYLFCFIYFVVFATNLHSENFNKILENIKQILANDYHEVTEKTDLIRIFDKSNFTEIFKTTFKSNEKYKYGEIKVYQRLKFFAYSYNDSMHTQNLIVKFLSGFDGCRGIKKLEDAKNRMIKSSPFMLIFNESIVILIKTSCEGTKSEAANAAWKKSKEKIRNEFISAGTQIIYVDCGGILHSSN
ncbi:hypothetical protein KC799_25740 [candidate division KSB1 bacterium]|nr:hypothetical protein [candidate division KSB1 bacterium]